MSKYYVCVDIGCLECAEDTNVLGIFTDKNKAEKILKEHEERQQENWHGQHAFKYFEIEELDKEYPIEYEKKI